MRIGDVVCLPKGWKVGAGRLKASAPGTVAAVQSDESGEPIYRVFFSGKKRGRDIERSTWVGAGEIDLIRGRCR